MSATSTELTLDCNGAPLTLGHANWLEDTPRFRHGALVVVTSERVARYVKSLLSPRRREAEDAPPVAPTPSVPSEWGGVWVEVSTARDDEILAFRADAPREAGIPTGAPVARVMNFSLPDTGGRL